MALTRTLAEMRTETRNLTDQANSSFVSDAELTRILNVSIAKLYAMLVEARGDEYYRTSSTIATTPGTNVITAPLYFKVLGVDLVESPRNITGRKLEFMSRNRVDPYTDSASVIVYYIPEAPTLSGDSDTFDGINRWEEWAIYDAAIRINAKGQYNLEELARERQMIENKLKASAVSRDYGEPAHVQDVRRLRSYFYYLLRGASIDLFKTPSEYFAYTG